MLFVVTNKEIKVVVSVTCRNDLVAKLLELRVRLWVRAVGVLELLEESHVLESCQQTM